MKYHIVKSKNGCKYFIEKFEAFINYCFRIVVKWLVRKVKSPFKVISTIPYPSCVIYRAQSLCWEEKNEPRRHLSSKISYLLEWEILIPAPKDEQTRKNVEVLFIAVIKLSLNEQMKSNVLHLFQNNIIWGRFLITLITFYFIFYWFYNNTWYCTVNKEKIYL